MKVIGVGRTIDQPSARVSDGAGTVERVADDAGRRWRGFLRVKAKLNRPTAYRTFTDCMALVKVTVRLSSFHKALPIHN